MVHLCSLCATSANVHSPFSLYYKPYMFLPNWPPTLCWRDLLFCFSFVIVSGKFYGGIASLPCSAMAQYQHGLAVRHYPFSVLNLGEVLRYSSPQFFFPHFRIVAGFWSIEFVLVDLTPSSCSLFSFHGCLLILY